MNNHVSCHCEGCDSRRLDVAFDTAEMLRKPRVIYVIPSGGKSIALALMARGVLLNGATVVCAGVDGSVTLPAPGEYILHFKERWDMFSEQLIGTFFDESDLVARTVAAVKEMHETGVPYNYTTFWRDGPTPKVPHYKTQHEPKSFRPLYQPSYSGKRTRRTQALHNRRP